MTGETIGSRRRSAVRLKMARKHKPSSQKWLLRQLNDPYVIAAKEKGLRSRAAFKLIELDGKFGLIRKGARVVDLGAAPGGWTQVALERGAARVVGIDLLDIEPIGGAVLIKGDFQDDSMAATLAEALGGPVDLVMSDMAPNTTGHTATDHLRIMGLAELALDFAFRHLAPGGAFVTKLFQGGAQGEMLETLKRRFAVVRHAKPEASRKDSRELYVVATGYRPEEG
ncbi:MAG TPA: RlmE family RNA methyltransferase [Acidiphilium sp.]|uniref:RlmE family RNA methyltransferase n=1 Tax=unclassified Acidiphilium TaxID=2617493 RepID=UPI000BD8E6A5|nr:MULTISPECIES: RlmE family RNA methyltransferase [unclassified Acidiphilium]OYV55392.1 MAG: rRNA methyltransferase [Acidiphilium sp. 20-67-58]OYV84473.1 MAG: rRNA methyltransferase [Acidiphilium sp. 21-68-69]HQT61870.1 RlmE family RNA methyltransferase [Acidiphilium sp.]HQU10763.1 RlmE family RNA methyltransferase [Acidiphilium sp.]